MSPLDRVLEALRSHGCNPKQNGSGWSSRCPHHADEHPSLSVSEGDDSRVLMHCHVGCELDDIVRELELDACDLFPEDERSERRQVLEQYPYTDEDGQLLYEVVRFTPKDFRQRRPDGNGGWIWNMQDVRRVLYRLPQVVEAVRTGADIFIPEGERDVHAIEMSSLDAIATCNPMGAGKWRHEYSDMLRCAARVFVVADRDPPGRAHARHVAAELDGLVDEVVVVEPVEGNDVSDHLAAGRTLDELEVVGHEDHADPVVDDDGDDGERHQDHLPGVEFGRVDLGAIVRGDQPPTQPTMFARSDGQGLLYRGGRHDIHGEPGSGKSMAATAAAAEELADGGRVAVLDYEATGAMFVERGLALGIPADVLDDPARVAYFNPGHMNTDEIAVFAKMLKAFDPTLVVIDAVGPAMGRQGLDENVNPDVARWHADFVEPIRAGVTLLLIDHVSRDRQNRQRGGRGGWMKLQLLDVSYTVKTFKAFSRTQDGWLKLSCAKDRFGTYAIGVIVAAIHVTPHDNGDQIDFDVRAPDDQEGSAPWRPTGLMEKLSRALERRTAADDLPDREDTLDLVPGRAQYKRQALAGLVDGGYVDDFQDGRHRRYRSIRPYREADDPGADPGPEADPEDAR
jgi:AAA domain